VSGYREVTTRGGGSVYPAKTFCSAKTFYRAETFFRSFCRNRVVDWHRSSVSPLRHEAAGCREEEE
jgi:hypothetical protein